ncbi:IS4 family transposase [Desulfurivibrio sp. C05AmB]|uniref:IS4 family transposase n=1 Tax=Desulfurivibrio sp. C05AmB TaxID=3374371 RepID=UPI00376F44E0
MAHHNTILRQIAAFLPRHEFDSLAKDHHRGQKFRSFSRWTQFMAMFTGQLSGRQSLRDIVMNLGAQARKAYHLGIRACSRATLARVNENQPASLYEAVFFKLLERCRQFAPGHRFKFKNRLYLLDATTIDLCLAVFPWAKFRKTKGAIKLHVGLDADGYLPSFIALTDGKGHESQWAKALNLPRGSIAVFDRGFNDYQWYQALTKAGVFFVTRLKSNAVLESGPRRPGLKAGGITDDREVFLNNIPEPFRLVCFLNPDTGKEFRFLTNAHHLDAKTITELYRERWQIELFFKWIKQNLKVKTFLGTTKNAVLTQLWIALCVYLLLAFLKFKAKIDLSMQQMLRLLQLNLFERRDLMALLKPPERQFVECRQFPLF